MGYNVHDQKGIGIGTGQGSLYPKCRTDMWKGKEEKGRNGQGELQTMIWICTIFCPSTQWGFWMNTAL